MAENKEPTLAQEAGLPDSWHPVDSAPINPSGEPSRPNPMANYFAGPISPAMQHDFVFYQTRSGTMNIPFLPLMPFAPNSTPAVNSSTQNVVNISSGGGGGGGSSTVPGGANTDVQINRSGVFYGDNGFAYNPSTQIVAVSGSLTVGIDVTAVVFNATTGFQIGGVAASGKYLRGDGTNFVSATLSGSDILTGIVGVTYGGTGANLSATGGANQVVQQTSVGGAFTVGQLSFTNISGILGVASGGTGANLSATGGANQVVQQTSVGGVFTVGQLAASNLSNGTTGSGSVVLATSPTFVTGLTSPVVILTAATPTTVAGQVGFGTTAGFGAGSSGTAVTTTTLGAGSGPTNAEVVVNYLEIDIAGTKFWMPLMQ